TQSSRRGSEAGNRGLRRRRTRGIASVAHRQLVLSGRSGAIDEGGFGRFRTREDFAHAESQREAEPLARNLGGERGRRLTGSEVSMDGRQKNIAVARGEAVAANLLAWAAIQTALTIISNREEVLAGISAFIDEALNMGGPGKGDAHDEFNTQMRETARFQAMQSLDAIARMFRNPPASG